MSKLEINTGTIANDDTGDTLRDAFIKVNNNFLEIYNTFGSNNALSNTYIEVLSDAYDLVNTATSDIITINQMITDNTATAMIIYGQANAAFDQANVGISIAQDAYDQANTGTSVAQDAFGQANTGTSIAQDAFDQANVAYIHANSAFDQANIAFLHANSAFDQANVGIGIVQSAFNQANVAFIQANSAFDQANTGTSIAQDAFDQANLAFTTANSVPYIVSGFSTSFTSNSIILMHVFGANTYYGADLVRCKGVATSPVNNQIIFDITLNNTSVGSMVFPAANANATFISPSPITTTTSDVLQIIAPETTNSNLTSFAVTLVSTII